jgi:hypothetical protein
MGNVYILLFSNLNDNFVLMDLLLLLFSNYINCLVSLFCLCVFCFFFFTRAHFVIGLRAVKLA